METKKEEIKKTVDETLEKLEKIIPESISLKIKNKINDNLNYIPKIGVFGKAGAGKSSFCNVVFGKNLCEIDNIKGCTREPQEVLITLGEIGKGIILIDVPGIGESIERGEEYRELYKNMIPELDAIIWIFKADDRALEAEERTYKEIFDKNFPPLVFVINQIDKLEPLFDWEINANKPGKDKQKNINEKIKIVSEQFDFSEEWIIPISSTQKYNLATVIDKIVERLPSSKKIAFVNNVEEEIITEKTTENVKKGFFETVLEYFRDFTDDVKDKVNDIWDEVKGEVSSKIVTSMFNFFTNFFKK